MRFLLTLFFPWVRFFTTGRPIMGIICLLLQFTVVGWIPATIWSVYALSQPKAGKKTAAAMSMR